MSAQNSLPRLFILAPFFAFLAVATGAFGAHGLEAYLAKENMAWWETASKYLMYHSLASLLAIALYPHHSSFKYCSHLFCFGNILFAGSLFYMALTNDKAMALLTPIGGFFYLIAWLYMIWLFFRLKLKMTS